jgi:hypothetical protein
MPENLVRTLADNLDKAEADLAHALREHADSSARLTALDLQTRPDRRIRHQAWLDAERARLWLAHCQHAANTARQLLGACQPGAETTSVRQAAALVDAALGRQIDHAAARLTQEPAAYLTALLGGRPDHPQLAEQWDRDALAVEHYRHHTLGLAYGTPAAGPAAPAAEQALGPPPTDLADLHRYRSLCARQATLDLGAAI